MDAKLAMVHNWPEGYLLTHLHLRCPISGKTPENKTLDAKFMPWPGIGVHDDEELEALYNYLKSLPATPTDAKLQKKLDAMNAAITK